MTEEQIKWLEQNVDQATFNEVYSVPGVNRPVREYADEYGYLEDLFVGVCIDLNLTPPSLLLPTPK